MKTGLRLSRRTMLRGALAGGAVALGLPLLDAMLRNDGTPAEGAELGPIFGIFYWANGLPWHGRHGAMQGSDPNAKDLWTPSTTGAGYAPSELLLPLAAHQVSIVTGLEPKTEVPPSPPGQEDGHMRGFMVALTSDRIRPEGFDHASHTLTALRPSLDQYVAKHPDFYGKYPPRFRSLQVGVSHARFHDYGHWNAISYNGPDSLNLPIMDAGQLYDLLFSVPKDSAGLGRRAKLLDAVKDDAKSLRGRLGKKDGERIEEHLDHLSEIQRRLQLSTLACEAPPKPAGSPDLLEQTGIMARLLALALQCDVTRVFSFMLTSPATVHVFDNLGVPDGMHKTCHDGLWQSVKAITEYQMKCFARMMDELAAVVDPMGKTLMDRALIYGTSEYGEGWQHSDKEMPVLLAGRAAGKLKPGVHVREQDGNMSKAHVTLLRGLGLETPSYGFNGGETTETFGELLV
ncbi:MAG: DUF1552 domain-containing protein [Minicystis sp.]